MALYKEIDSIKFKLGVWKVTETLDELLALLPDNGNVYAEEINTFKAESRKREWLAVRVLLYTLTGETSPILYHSNGKPYFADGTSVSISHTKGYAAVIISNKCQVGLDIEQMGDRVNRVAHKFMQEDELMLQDATLRTKGLLLIWSAKETMFKCMDEEAVDFREHLRVKVVDLSYGWVVGNETRTEQRNTYLIHYMLDPDFVMTWTTF